MGCFVWFSQTPPKNKLLATGCPKKSISGYGWDSPRHRISRDFKSFNASFGITLNLYILKTTFKIYCLNLYLEREVGFHPSGQGEYQNPFPISSHNDNKRMVQHHCGITIYFYSSLLWLILKRNNWSKGHQGNIIKHRKMFIKLF